MHRNKLAIAVSLTFPISVGVTLPGSSLAAESSGGTADSPILFLVTLLPAGSTLRVGPGETVADLDATGGDLQLAGGTVNIHGTLGNANTFDGGVLTAIGDTSVASATFNASVTTLGRSGLLNTLTVAASTLNGGATAILGAGVTLSGTTLNGGALQLAGGQLTGTSQLNGGTLQAVQTTTLANAVFGTGLTRVTTAAGATLTVLDSILSSGATANIDSGTTLLRVTANDGNLQLAGGTVNVAGSLGGDNRFGGGNLTATGDTAIGGATFNAGTTALGTLPGASMNIGHATIGAGATAQVKRGVGFATLSVDGGTLVLQGVNLSGDTLFNGGSARAESGTVIGTSIIDRTRFASGSTVLTAAPGADLLLALARIDAPAKVNVGPGVDIPALTSDGGTLVLNGATLSGISRFNGGTITATADSRLDELRVGPGTTMAGTSNNVALSIARAIIDLPSATLTLGEGITLDHLRLNGGSVGFSGTPHRLHVGDLSGTGLGVLNFRVFSPTAYDSLRVATSASGSQQVRLVYAGTPGADLGKHFTLRLVDSTAATDSTSYALDQKTYRLGFFEYTATPLFEDGFGVTLDKSGLDETLSERYGNAALTGMQMRSRQVEFASNLLSKRLGELRLTNDSGNQLNGGWIRAYARHSSVDSALGTEMDVQGLEAGYDHLLVPDVIGGKVFVGATLGMSWGNASLDPTSTGLGDTDGTAPSAGLYATWLDPEGWYADATFRYFWGGASVNAVAVGAPPQVWDQDGSAWATTIEFGRRFDLAPHGNRQVFIEPRLHFLYGQIKGSTAMVLGVPVAIEDFRSSLLSPGITVGVRQDDGDHKYEGTLRLATKTEFDGTIGATVGSRRYSDDIDETRLEVGAGLNAQLTGATSFYLDLAWEKGTKTETWGGNAGLRVRF